MNFSKGSGIQMTVLIILILFAVAMWLFANQGNVNNTATTQNTGEGMADPEEEDLEEPPNFPIREGYYHGLLCYSDGPTPVYAVVLLKDYSKLEGLVNGCFDAGSFEGFKQVAHSEELTTYGYFLFREKPNLKINFGGEYEIVLDNEKVTCRFMRDTRIDVIPLGDEFFPAEEVLAGDFIVK